MTALARLFASAASPAEYVRGYCQRVAEVVAGIDAEAVARCIARLEEAAHAHKTIFCIANGGSAAVASHFVNDMCPNSFVAGHPPYRVLCLTDNVESITAIANDFGYDDVFARQVRALGRAGDVAVALSTSGRSPSVLRAVDACKALGIRTIGLTGGDGGQLASAVDVALVVTASTASARIQETHITIGHVLCELVDAALSGGRP